MQRNSICRCVGTGLLFVFISPTSRADDTESKTRINDADRVTTDAAKLYEFEIASQPPRILDFHPKSILRWSNPVAGEIYGNVFLWTEDQRPQVIGSIYQWYSPMTHGSHEFRSLAVEPLAGTRDGRAVWTSPEAGIAWNAVPESPPVADSRPLRLRQARAIARRFQVEKTDREKVTRELRLLAQPIYRYGSANSDVLDGSLFVFVQGTDPEVFLMIETRGKGQQRQWHYALARMNSVQFIASYQGHEVWRRNLMLWKKVKSGQGTYNAFGPFRGKAAKK